MVESEIKISTPYFELLGDKTINENLRILLIKHAPKEFYSVLTQTVRHILNGTFCTENSDFCEKFENSLYIIALPSTSLKDKRNILLSESYILINQLFEALSKALKE